MYKSCITCKGRGAFIVKEKEVKCTSCKGEGFIEVKEEEGSSKSA